MCEPELDRAELELAYNVTLPARFIPTEVFPGIDGGAGGDGGECTVVAGIDAGGAALFCLTCEASGIAEGLLDHDAVQNWHSCL